MKKIWAIYKKHEEIINYLIVGVCTTIFSLIFYFASTRTFLDPNNPFELQIANIIKWVSGVLFAYVTKMGIWDVIATLVSQVLVTVGNYILSKLLVFRNKKN